MKTLVVDERLNPEKRLEALLAKHGIEMPEAKKPAPKHLYTGLPPELTERQNRGAKSLAILGGVGGMIDEMAAVSTSPGRRAELKADSHEMLALWEKLYKPRTDDTEK